MYCNIMMGSLAVHSRGFLSGTPSCMVTSALCKSGAGSFEGSCSLTWNCARSVGIVQLDGMPGAPFHVATQIGLTLTVDSTLGPGAGPGKLVTDMAMSPEAAAKTISDWHDAYPGVGAYIKSVVRQCRAQGYVTTLGGRRRYLSAIASVNLDERRRAERQAVNTVAQGSAADLIKQVEPTQ